MSAERKAAAQRAAMLSLRNAVPSPGLFRSTCDQTVLWVFNGGRDNEPHDEMLTQLVCETVTTAVEAGFAHAYGDTRRGEIDPGVIARLARLTL